MERLQSSPVQPHFFRPSFLPEGLFNHKRLVLKKILLRYMGLSLTREQPPLSKNDVEDAGLLPELETMARKLGIGNHIPQEAGPVETEVNGIAIALDEEWQFNHYRLLTLDSALYAEPLVCRLSRYRAYCMGDAGKKSGRERVNKKVTDKAETLGKTQKPQVALKDFMQDMLPLVHYVPLLRLSVFDSVPAPNGIRTVGSLLEKDERKDYPIIAGFLEEKLSQLESSFCLDY